MSGDGGRRGESYDWSARQMESELGMARTRTAPAATSSDYVWSHTPGSYERWVKPVVDVGGSLVLSSLALPVILFIVVVIWITMGRPAILRQPRVGKSGEIFELFKFRTMNEDLRKQQLSFPGPDRRKVHKSPHDPRLTGVGRFLRRWSLDELPQLWNVVLGDMSLVGPRPEMVEIVERHYEPWQHKRHVVKPGITGLWQISVRGEDGLMHQNSHVDLAYVERISFLTDMRILFLTVPTALGVRRGY